jgi:hypothetical protein
MTDLTQQTPQQIDEQLAELYYEKSKLYAKLAQADKMVTYFTSGRGSKDFNAASHLIDAQNKVEALVEALGVNAEATVPLNAEYVRRGRWTRAYLVVNSNGHVHSTMGCSTCFYSTEFYWVTDLSDHDEFEIVEKAGERACTVCYPSAPVETLSRPTQIFTPDEQEKAKAREERAQKRAQKEADKVLDPETGRELFGTVRGATNFVSGELQSMHWYGSTHPSYSRWVADVERTLKAVAAKTGQDYDTLYAEADAKAAKKVAKDRRG